MHYSSGYLVFCVLSLLSCIIPVVYLVPASGIYVMPYHVHSAFCLGSQEDAALVEKRSFLLMRQQRLKAALGKIDDFAPDVLAVSK